RIVGEELDNYKDEVPFGKIRFVAKISGKELFETPKDPRFKSIESIAQKIERRKYNISDFEKGMSDIFRFRITCNYLSDVRKLVKKIRNSKKISDTFTIDSDEDKIVDMRVKEPNKVKGVRCHVFGFKVKNTSDCPTIELQIMTMLQEAWDKKDHYLIYEPERKGIKVSHEGKLKMQAMSELLYVADEFFDSIQDLLSSK
ncbi:hypothetical protein KAU34_09700, partial [candidate division WOR-3 bacterium]|nr:hypothetical protein [candidate division WOR-3 bacterium]